MGGNDTGGVPGRIVGGTVGCSIGAGTPGTTITGGAEFTGISPRHVVKSHTHIVKFQRDTSAGKLITITTTRLEIEAAMRELNTSST